MRRLLRLPSVWSRVQRTALTRVNWCAPKRHVLNWCSTLTMHRSCHHMARTHADSKSDKESSWLWTALHGSPLHSTNLIALVEYVKMPHVQ
jgi:hypothetical protein